MCRSTTAAKSPMCVRQSLGGGDWVTGYLSPLTPTLYFRLTPGSPLRPPTGSYIHRNETAWPAYGVVRAEAAVSEAESLQPAAWNGPLRPARRLASH